MGLEDYAKKILNDPDADEDDKYSINSLMNSHLASGMKLQQQGLLLEAISEFAKENNRPIHSDIDKEIAESSYWHIGVAYHKLGQLENAKKAFQQARNLFNQYHKGIEPHYDLAKLLLEEGKLDEAIEVCKEYVNKFPRGATQRLLDRLLAMKKGKSE